jgi:hypothetical protein
VAPVHDGLAAVAHEGARWTHSDGARRARELAVVEAKGGGNSGGPYRRHGRVVEGRR